MSRPRRNTDKSLENCCPCGLPDSGKMVECERCLIYHHYTCADVGDSIANDDRQFVCKTCTQLAIVSHGSRSGRSSTSSTRAARAALELQRLEEEKQLHAKQLADEAQREKSQREKAFQLEQQFLAKKYDLLLSQLDEPEDAGSVRSRRSSRGARRIADWVDSQSVPTSASTGIKPTTTGQQSRTGSTVAAPVSTVQAKVSDAMTLLPPSADRLTEEFAQLQERMERLQQKLRSASNHADPPATSIPKSQPLMSQGLPTSRSQHLLVPPLQYQPIRSQPAITWNPRLFASTRTSTLPSRTETPFVSSSIPQAASVSQACFDIITTNQINESSLSVLDTPPNAHIHSIPQPIPLTEPCTPPPRPPAVSHDFQPSIGSTPLAYQSLSRPSVQTVSSFLSPVVTPSIQSTPQHPQQPFNGPNPQQLAARHVVPKDLPLFSGDPVEWPLFFSSYRNSTEMCGFSDGENLLRLQRCLKGNAMEAVRSFLLNPSSVPIVIDTLQTLYGRPELIINSLLLKVRGMPAPRTDKLDTLIKFGLACKNLCAHLQAAGQLAHLANPSLLQELIEKLPPSLRLDWAMYKRGFPVADLTTFGSFMSNLVSAASDVTFSHVADNTTKEEKRQPREKLFVNTHSTDNMERREEPFGGINASERKDAPVKSCPICQEPGHKARDCSTFREMSLNDRWKSVQERYLCRRCLIGHGKFPCKASVCGYDGCEERHHKLLHPGKPGASSVEGNVVKTTVAAHHQSGHTVLFRVVPVTLYGKGTSLNTYAFLDDGSSSTLIDIEIAEELGLSGDIHPLCLQWTNDIERTEQNSRVVRLDISGTNASKLFTMREVHTVKNLSLPVQTLSAKELCEKYVHLRGLPIQSYIDARPRILIGLDNSHLKAVLKLREGGKDAPIAAKTRLGWTIYGKIPGPMDQVHRQLHICAQTPEQQLHDLVNQFFSLENVGVTLSPLLESDEEKRARKILEETTTRTSSGRYQSGLLWKYDFVEFNNSRPMAERRLQCLERRLQTNPELYASVKQLLADYQTKGYAHKATANELQNADPKRTWYLPLGVVANPRKPGKLRLIWDAAAKAGGQSFNSMLLSGPDLLTPLSSVLCRFRQRKVAVSADIREMFHQVEIRPEDRQAQRFLWRDDASKPPEVFIMDVAIFGSTCSPCTAQYVKNRNAVEHADQHPQASAAIIENTYVDDVLFSLDTEEEAIQLAEEVKFVNSKAGFDTRNWLSNSAEVLEQVGDAGEEQTKSFKADKLENYERILGMTWLPEEDTFVFEGLFKPEILLSLNNCSTPTKRELLRIVMSIFDPLGLIAIIVIHGKILIQNVWRSGTAWDQPISDDLRDQWMRWTGLLKELERIKIPRCYFPGYDPSSFENIELHVFVDASEEAYACTAYFRIFDQGRVRCSLVSAKTKVAPLKPLSIPKLELQAAVIGARLARTVMENHSLKIAKRVLWTDSSTVLSWLRSDVRKYRQFVAHRVSEILDLTTVDEWRWIPTRLNVADDATKWGKGPQIDESSRWFRAPDFFVLSSGHLASTRYTCSQHSRRNSSSSCAPRSIEVSTDRLWEVFQMGEDAAFHRLRP
ncbi:uncharacterized protein LOC115257239 isoform X2 [Aedes albopictus]|uniref:CCHC-type domain-containing protein n=1 Tax=Aedes albopictus TaxID=7160 RepID=A0ABM1XTQ3_AEDAL